jgi:hypothetical protein
LYLNFWIFFFVLLGQIDLGGWVPAMLVNVITKDQPMNIAKIRDVCATLK